MPGTSSSPVPISASRAPRSSWVYSDSRPLFGLDDPRKARREAVREARPRHGTTARPSCRNGASCAASSTDDLPLNVSRAAPGVPVARTSKQVTKRIVDLLDELAEKPDEYKKVWNAFRPDPQEAGRRPGVEGANREAHALAVDSRRDSSRSTTTVSRGRRGPGGDHWVAGESRAARSSTLRISRR